VEPQPKGAPATPSPGLSIVVPAYNEARRLPVTLPRLIAYAGRLGEPAEIIIVDDGSVDGTSDVAHELGRASGLVSVLRSPQNAGKGASVRRGMLAARHDHVLFTDADLSTPIEEAAKLRAALGQGADVAIGSRRAAGSEIQIRQPWLRELAGRTFSRVVALLLLPGIGDSQCGFKAFRWKAAQEVLARQRLDGFGFDPEVLWLARRLGYRVVEVPIVWRDDPRSRVRLVRDSVGMLLDLGRIRVNAWAGRYALTGVRRDPRHAARPATGGARRGQGEASETPPREE
jgi:dolichyl-phosphate beta-glucosyltransferase